MSSSIAQATLRASVVEACTSSISAYAHPSRIRYVILEPYFIKWGDRSLHGQAETQKYVYDQAAQDTSTPRVPKVHDCFDHGHFTYLVMELIPSSPVTNIARFAQETATALDWLRRLPLPPNPRIGDLGGGYAHHPIFQDWEAPLRFSSVEALEKYLNKALERIPPAYRPQPVHIRDEALVFSQYDMHEENFMLDLAGRFCLVDFESICLLPESFAVYTVQVSGKEFVHEVSKYLSWSSNSLSSMSRAAGILVMCADTTLGLDEDGNYRQKRVVKS